MLVFLLEVSTLQGSYHRCQTHFDNNCNFYQFGFVLKMRLKSYIIISHNVLNTFFS